MTLQGVLLSGKNQPPKGSMLCRSIYVAFLKCQRYRDEHNGGGQGLRRTNRTAGQLGWDKGQHEEPLVDEPRLDCLPCDTFS